MESGTLISGAAGWVMQNKPGTPRTEELCLYRNENGRKSCYPNSGGGIAVVMHRQKLNVGDSVLEPLRSADEKFHKMQVVKCKWPECL